MLYKPTIDRVSWDKIYSNGPSVLKKFYYYTYYATHHQTKFRLGDLVTLKSNPKKKGYLVVIGDSYQDYAIYWPESNSVTYRKHHNTIQHIDVVAGLNEKIIPKSRYYLRVGDVLKNNGHLYFINLNGKLENIKTNETLNFHLNEITVTSINNYSKTSFLRTGMIYNLLGYYRNNECIQKIYKLVSLRDTITHQQIENNEVKESTIQVLFKDLKKKEIQYTKDINSLEGRSVEIIMIFRTEKEIDLLNRFKRYLPINL